VLEDRMSVADVITGLQNRTYAWSNGWTETSETDDGSRTFSSAEHATTADGTDMASADVTVSLNWQALAAVSLRPVSALSCNFEHFVARQEAQISKTSTEWSADTGASIAGSNFTLGDDYLIMVWAENDSDNGNNNTGIRVTHGGTAFTESQTIEETGDTGEIKKTPYFWFTVWDSENEAIAVEYYNQTNGATARVEDVTLLVMNVDDLIANGDLQYDIQTGRGDLNSTPTAKASITWTPDNNGDTWWIMSYAQANIEDDSWEGPKFQARIDIDTNERQQYEFEGEDTSDTPLYGLGWVTTLDNSSHTISIELSETGQDQAWDSAGIFALRLDAFAQFAIDANSSDGTTLSNKNQWFEQAGVDPNVAETVDWLIAAGAWQIQTVKGYRAAFSWVIVKL
jgi:hypothetical protein